MKAIALSIEQMRYLKDLGVDTNKASMHWQYIPTADNIMGKDDSEELALFVSEDYKMEHCFPAFMLQDILEMMPKELKLYDLVLFADNHIQYEKWDMINPAYILCQFDGDGLLDVSYQMLCWLAENGYLKGDKK